MNRDELLARIRRCLALAKSSNEHEAAAALAKARQLMDEYGVDQTDIDSIDVGELFARGGGALTPAGWEVELVHAVTRAIPVEVLSCGDAGWAFIGLRPGPEIAAYAFTSLYRQLKRARADYMTNRLRRVRSPRRKTARADAFAEGWAETVWRAVARLYPAQETDAIVLAWLARRYPNRSSLTPRSLDAGKAGENDRFNGQLAGRDVQLAQGIGGGTEPTLCLGGANG